MNHENVLLLAIESSCDETSAAVLQGDVVLSNVIATQAVHEQYGGVVPELAGRAHQSNIVPVVQQAIYQANIDLKDLHAVAVTQGPGLMGSLHVGVSFAKSLSMALGIPVIGVNHMRAHILAHFIRSNSSFVAPALPMLCLTVSGGHTQLVLVNKALEMEIIGATIDDAAGEAFDKAAKVLGLPYPGGPQVDVLAESGDPLKFKFAVPKRNGFNYSFSGLKTSLLYFLRDELKKDPAFITRELPHICASYRKAIVDYLMVVLCDACLHHDVNSVALAGGVSANRELRRRLMNWGELKNIPTHIPPFEYCTDNAAMIGIAAWFQWQSKEWMDWSMTPQPALKL
jgi:N6-L-threonylcarbamoyladenine synthase